MATNKNPNSERIKPPANCKLFKETYRYIVTSSDDLATNLFRSGKWYKAYTGSLGLHQNSIASDTVSMIDAERSKTEST
ncbi:hypothetical protein GCM10027180_11550 [Microbulbifer echini]